MPVREFDGVDDYLRLTGALGNLASASTGLSVVLLWKGLSTPSTIECITSIGNASNQTIASIYQPSGSNAALTDGADDPNIDLSAALTITENVWAILALTKAPGSSVARMHFKQLGAGSWQHVDSTTAGGPSTTAATAWWFSTFASATPNGFRDERIALGALYARALTDAELVTIEAAASTAALDAAGPIDIVELNQASTATPVTGLHGVLSQAAINQTTVITGDDPAWTYSPVGTPTIASSSIGSVVTPVPAGLAQDDEVVLVVSTDGASGSTIGNPGGFTVLADGFYGTDGQRYWIGWKRQGATPDSGNYTQTLSATAPWASTAIPIRGRDTSAPPVLSTIGQSNSATTATANGVTALAGDALLFINIPDAPTSGVISHSAWLAPFLEIVDNGIAFAQVGVAKTNFASAGATGNPTVTMSGTSGFAAWVLRLPAAGGVSPSGTGIGLGTIGGGTIGVRGTTGLTITGTGIASAQAFGSGTVQPGPVSVAPGGIASAQAFGASTVQPGPATVAPAGIGSAEAFGSPWTSVGYPALVLSTSGLLGYWRLNDAGGSTIAADQRRLHDGTILGGTTPGFGGIVAGAPGQPSTFFDGTTGSGVSVPFPTGPTSAITVEAWLYTEPYSPDGFQRVIDRGSTVFASPYSDWAMEVKGTAGAWIFEVQINGAWYTFLTNTTGIADETTHHFVATFDGSDVRLYLDGQLDATYHQPGALNDSGNPILFGRYGSPDPANHGDICRYAGRGQEYALYNRALTSTEITTHYLVGSGAVSVAPAGIASSEAFGAAAVQPGAVSVAPTGIASAQAFGAATVQPGAVTVAPTGIASAQAFGATVVQPGAVSITGTGIASAQAFGSTSLAVTTSPTGIGSAEAFGAATVQPVQSVTLTGIASAEALGVATVATGPVSIATTGIATAQAFGAATVAPGPVTASLAGIGSAEAFGATTVQPTQLVTPTGITSAEAFGAATLTTGPASISTTGIPSGQTFGALTVAPGPVTDTPTGIPSAEAFGAAAVTPGPVTATLTGIASAQTFGAASVQPGPVSITGTGIASAGAFGATVLTVGPTTVALTGVASGEAFGNATLIAGGTLVQPVGIASAQAFGLLALVPGPVTVTGTGIPSAEAFGALRLDEAVRGTGIPSGEAFGQPALGLTIALTGIPTAEALGQARLDLAPLAIGIPSAEAFGSTLVRADQRLSLTGIASGESFGATTVGSGITTIGIPTAQAFGASTIQPGPVTAAPAGIGSAEAFGVLGTIPDQFARPAGIPSVEAFGAATLQPGPVIVTVAGIASGESFGHPGIEVLVVAVAVPSAEAFGGLAVIPAAVAVLPAGVASAETFGALRVFVPPPNLPVGQRTAILMIAARAAEILTERHGDLAGPSARTAKLLIVREETG